MIEVTRVKVVTCGRCVSTETVMLTLRLGATMLGLVLKVQSNSMVCRSMPTTSDDIAATGNLPMHLLSRRSKVFRCL